jgi:hypothetical protein
MATMTIPARLADLEFEIDAPPGFMEPPLPESDPDFNDPTVTGPLTLLATPVAAAFLAVAARPAYEEGSVLQWLIYLARHYGITTTALTPGEVGGRRHHHPAVIAEGRQVQDGTNLRMVFAALEDGGRLVIIHAMCPEELWPSYGEGLRAAVASFELARPQGPKAPLVPVATE